MQKSKRFRVVVLVSLLVMVLLSACATRVNYTGKKEVGQYAYTYDLFTGNEYSEMLINSGEALRLKYDIVVEQGLLRLKLYDPDGAVIWNPEFTQSSGESIKLDITQPGIYKLVIEGENTKGSFDISWVIR